MFGPLGASGCVREVHGEQRIVWRKCATTCVNPQCSAGQCRWSDASVGRCLGLGLVVGMDKLEEFELQLRCKGPRYRCILGRTPRHCGVWTHKNLGFLSHWRELERRNGDAPRPRLLHQRGAGFAEKSRSADPELGSGPSSSVKAQSTRLCHSDQ